MALKTKEFPEEGDLIIATVTKVMPYGAFVKLDEYADREGLIHVSEVASTWVRNIRDHVREGQKAVARVLRVDPTKGHIDLSLKRITDQQKRDKIQEWKRAQKAEKLLGLAAKKMRKRLKKAYEEIGSKLEEKYGELYAAFEDAAKKGKDALVAIGIQEKWADTLTKIAQENVEFPSVEIVGYVDLKCPGPTGIETIKDALLKTKEISEDDVKLEVTYVGAPRYRIHVTAPDYKLAEKVLEKAVEATTSTVEKAGGSAEFHRLTKKGVVI